jgi:hypothetical protein
MMERPSLTCGLLTKVFMKAGTLMTLKKETSPPTIFTASKGQFQALVALAKSSCMVLSLSTMIILLTHALPSSLSTIVSLN